MSLDTLYGEGSSETFAKAVPRDGLVEEIDLPDGTVRVNVRWENGSRMKLHFRGDEVSFLHLHSEGRGLYAALVKDMLKVFKDFGIKQFIAMPTHRRGAQDPADAGQVEADPLGRLGMEDLMPYVPPVDWEDTPSTDTPLNDTNITAMETALALWASYGEFRVNTTPVASGTSIDPPDNYLVHTVSGTADISTIAAQAAGKMIVLLFSGDAATTGLVTDSGNLRLETSMLYAAGDAIALVCDGTNWIEIGRNEAARMQATNDLGSLVASKANLATLNASGMGYTNHGATGTIARPADFEGALFVGSVTPTNADRRRRLDRHDMKITAQEHGKQADAKRPRGADLPVDRLGDAAEGPRRRHLARHVTAR